MATHPRIDHKSIAPPALPPANTPIPASTESSQPLPIPTPSASVSTPTPITVETAAPSVPPAVNVTDSRSHGSTAWDGMHSPFGPTNSNGTATVFVNVTDPMDEDEEPIFNGHTMFTAFPSWLVSMTVHLLVVLLTALFVLPNDPPPRPFELVLGEASAAMDDMESLAAFEMQSFEGEPVEDPAEFEEEVEPMDDADDEFDPLEDLADSLNDDATILEDVLTMTTTADLSSEVFGGGSPSGGATPAPTIAGGIGLRSTQRSLADVIKAGGSEESEEAVARALRWLAKMQRNDGSWDLQDRPSGFGRWESSAKNGATGLALLPFLGAGHTHKDGEYRYVVQRGLEFLQKKMRRRGDGKTAKASLTDQHGNYYSHGLCTIAMCEAYAMTRDSKLRVPAQQLINEIVDAQDPSGGGWRYDRHQRGDTSVLGWQLMALKSGKMAYLHVPDKTFRGATRFLNSVQRDYGSTYGYTSPGRRPGTTAVGLLSRMYLGWSRDTPPLSKGAVLLSKQGPDKDEIYFSYYATQVLHHYGGPRWKKWNVEMRDSLVNSQVRDGRNDGSWKLNSGHSRARLYCTSMATMILEVYYRHMPLYQEQAADGTAL